MDAQYTAQASVLLSDLLSLISPPSPARTYTDTSHSRRSLQHARCSRRGARFGAPGRAGELRERRSARCRAPRRRTLAPSFARRPPFDRVLVIGRKRIPPHGIIKLPQSLQRDAPGHQLVHQANGALTGFVRYPFADAVTRQNGETKTARTELIGENRFLIVARKAYPFVP